MSNIGGMDSLDGILCLFVKPSPDLNPQNHSTRKNKPTTQRKDKMRATYQFAVCTRGTNCAIAKIAPKKKEKRLRQKKGGVCFENFRDSRH